MKVVLLVINAVWIAKAPLNSTEKPMCCGDRWDNTAHTVFKKSNMVKTE